MSIWRGSTGLELVHASENIADLKRLADAWQPLYQTLTLDHKWRKAALTIVALRDVASGIEQRRMMDY